MPALDGRRRIRQLGTVLDNQLDVSLRQRIATALEEQDVRDRRARDPLGPPDPADPRDPRNPRDPRKLTPGTPGPDRTLVAKELTTLVRRAISGDQRRTVWTFRGNETSVHLDRTRVATQPGLILVAVTLETDQTGVQELTVLFAVGRQESSAGLLAVAEERPRGHAELAATFAEAVIATAWRGLLLVVTAAAASAGTDASGDPLLPVALTARPEGLVVHTVADFHLGQQR